MKNFAIHSGNFSKKGNFTGYTALGESIFIHQAQMASLSWSTNEDVKFPFYAIGGIKQIGVVDGNRAPVLNEDGTQKTTDRLQAFSLFKDKQSMIDAHVDTVTLDIEVKSAVKEKATASGLTQTEMNSLLELA